MEPQEARPAGRAFTFHLGHLALIVVLGIIASVVTRRVVFALVAVMLVVLVLGLGSWMLTRRINGR